MKKRLSLVVLLGASVLAIQPPAAEPEPATSPSGPLCFSTDPFQDILVWFIDFHGSTPNVFQFDGVGRDLAGNRPQLVSVTIDPNVTTLTVGYTSYPSSDGFVPVVAGGTIDLATLSGPGQCFAPDLASCGDFTFELITCPAGAAPISSGRAQGAR